MPARLTAREMTLELFQRFERRPFPRLVCVVGMSECPRARLVCHAPARWVVKECQLIQRPGGGSGSRRPCAGCRFEADRRGPVDQADDALAGRARRSGGSSCGRGRWVISESESVALSTSSAISPTVRSSSLPRLKTGISPPVPAVSGNRARPAFRPATAVRDVAQRARLRTVAVDCQGLAGKGLADEIRQEAAVVSDSSPGRRR